MKVDLVGQTINQSSTTNVDRPQVNRPQEHRIPEVNNKNKENPYHEDKRYSEEEAIELIEKANNQFVAYDRKFEFSIHEKTRQIMIKVLDSTTNEVIKELPPEKVLDIVAGIWEVAGIMVDRKI